MAGRTRMARARFAWEFEMPFPDEDSCGWRWPDGLYLPWLWQIPLGLAETQPRLLEWFDCGRADIGHRRHDDASLLGLARAFSGIVPLDDVTAHRPLHMGLPGSTG